MPSPRTVLITGAFGSLGSAVATKFRDHGERVVLIDRAEAPAWVHAAFPPPHLPLSGVDLGDAAASAAAFARALGNGGASVLVNVAGGFRFETLARGSVATWELMFTMNLRTAVVACQAALAHLRAAGGGGRIINIGAGAAARAHAGMGAYTASKAGVERLSEALAEELKDQGITVNTILPGTIDTPANRAAMPNADVSRWVQPEEIADVVVFLASDAARAVTGAAIRVSGRG